MYSIFTYQILVPFYTSLVTFSLNSQSDKRESAIKMFYSCTELIGSSVNGKAVVNTNIHHLVSEFS
jgi:hypothetical protein